MATTTVIQYKLLSSELNFPLNIQVTALSPRWKYPRVGIIKKEGGHHFHYIEHGKPTLQYIDDSWRVWLNGVEQEALLKTYGNVVCTCRPLNQTD